MIYIKSKNGHIITEEHQIISKWCQYFQELTNTDIKRNEQSEEIPKEEYEISGMRFTIVMKFIVFVFFLKI